LIGGIQPNQPRRVYDRASSVAQGWMFRLPVGYPARLDDRETGSWDGALAPLLLALTPYRRAVAKIGSKKQKNGSEKQTKRHPPPVQPRQSMVA
jgi:hypothetical protein